MPPRRGQFLPWVRLLLSIAAFIGAGFLAIAKDLNPAPSIPILLAVTAILVVVGAVLPSLSDFRFGRALEAEWLVTAELRAAFSFLVNGPNDFSPWDLRLHCFHVRRIWQWRWPPYPKALVRVAYFSIKNDAPLSDVRWTKGTGLVGEVWKDKDIRGRAENVHVDPGPNAGAWATRPAEVRRNMTWEQAKTTEAIEVVFAVAVLANPDEGEVVAVLSADTSAVELSRFDSPSVKAFLRQTGRAAWNSRNLRRGK